MRSNRSQICENKSITLYNAVLYIIQNELNHATDKGSFLWYTVTRNLLRKNFTYWSNWLKTYHFKF